jgi:hypothetical protein
MTVKYGINQVELIHSAHENDIFTELKPEI